MEKINVKSNQGLISSIKRLLYVVNKPLHVSSTQMIVFKVIILNCKCTTNIRHEIYYYERLEDSYKTKSYQQGTITLQVLQN